MMKGFSVSSSFPPCLPSVRQRSRSSRRRRPGGGRGLLPDPLHLLSPHLPARPMPARRRRLCLLPSGRQSGSHAERQPIVSHRALFPPQDGGRHGSPAHPAVRQLQLWQPECGAADPIGAAAGPAPASPGHAQPRHAELERQRSRGEVPGGVVPAVDTGWSSCILDLSLS